MNCAFDGIEVSSQVDVDRLEVRASKLSSLLINVVSEQVFLVHPSVRDHRIDYAKLLPCGLKHLKDVIPIRDVDFVKQRSSVTGFVSSRSPWMEQKLYSVLPSSSKRLAAPSSFQSARARLAPFSSYSHELTLEPA